MKNSFAKKFDKVSSLSRGTAVGCVLAALCLGAFVGCDDDESGFATRPDGTESSSSSSVTLSPSTSSGQALESNGSSETRASSSSSAGKVNCSALMEGETGWNWDVPKECRFNPDIDYGSMTDERDGKVYRTVTIGDQVWMAENLNYADSIATPSLLGKSWCFDNEEKKCNIAGRFYTWAAAIDSVKFATDEINPRNCGSDKRCNFSKTVQGICPNGWHLPSDTEFWTLLESMSKKGTLALGAGYILKASPGGWINAKSLTDKFGFSALPVGKRCAEGDFSAGSSAYFWTTTEYNQDDVQTFGLYSRSDAADWCDGHKKYCAYSVRCVKD